MTTCSGKSCSCGLSICVCASFPFGFLGGMLGLIVLILDQCLYFYFLHIFVIFFNTLCMFFKSDVTAHFIESYRHHLFCVNP